MVVDYTFWLDILSLTSEKESKRMVFFIVDGCTRLPLRGRGRCPRKPLPAERARGRGVFHGIARFAGLARGLFLLFKVYLLLPSSFSGFHRPFRGCSAFFGLWSFSAALAISLLPPAEGRCYHRQVVFIAIFLGPHSSIKYAQTSILFAYLQIFS